MRYRDHVGVLRGDNLVRPPLAGKVRGEDIHWDCATAEEQGLTWAAFYTPGTEPDAVCARCGKRLGQ